MPSTISMRFKTSLRPERRVVPCRRGELRQQREFFKLTRLRDTILERYSLLLSRTQALSTFLARPPPQPSTPHPTEQPSTDPILSKYLVHSLNPLPEPGTEKGDQVNPIARDIFEWVLSTLPNPALVAAESELLVTDGGGPEGWKSLDELKGLSDVQLNKLSRELRDRLGRESQRAEVMREEIDRKDGEMDWEMRILDDTAEEEGSAAGQKEEKEAAKDDDLFGEDDIVMVDPPDGTSSKKQVAPKAVEKDPQEGWKLADYLAYMDTGRMPRATLGS